MKLHLMRGAAGWLWLAAATMAAGEARAHGGLAMEKDYCKLRVGPFVMHFTGYQPADGYTREFCEDIPSTGQTIVILDFIDDALRDLPVGLRIIQDDGSGRDPDSATVHYAAPKIYPMGTFSFDYKFQQSGNYVGLVTVGEGAQQVVGRFPFSVGLGLVYGLWRWRGHRAAKTAEAKARTPDIIFMTVTPQRKNDSSTQ